MYLTHIDNIPLTLFVNKYFNPNQTFTFSPPFNSFMSSLRSNVAHVYGYVYVWKHNFKANSAISFLKVESWTLLNNVITLVHFGFRYVTHIL